MMDNLTHGSMGHHSTSPDPTITGTMKRYISTWQSVSTRQDHKAQQPTHKWRKSKEKQEKRELGEPSHKQPALASLFFSLVMGRASKVLFYHITQKNSPPDLSNKSTIAIRFLFFPKSRN